MAGAHLIEPFPADIDRNHFGHYLSGFTDGEGCFELRLCGRMPPRRNNMKIPSATFQICLRADDLPLLRLIQSYFRCGGFSFVRASGNRHRSVRYAVSGVGRLVSTVIPHFQQYPLRAKKLRDFTVWCEGVRLINEVVSLPRGPGGRKGGNTVRWTAQRMARFIALKEALAATRKFDAPTDLPAPHPAKAEPSLFDGLPD